MRIYIVQGDPLAHHGEIILVTHDRDKAEKKAIKKILEWNQPGLGKLEKQMHEEYKTMDQTEFISKYMGYHYLCTPQISIHNVPCPGGE